MGKKRREKKEGIVTGQTQPLELCGTRPGSSTVVVNSALQPDRWCNSGMSTMLAHSRAIIAYGDGRSKVQVCVCVRVCVCVCVCVRACV